MFKTDYVYVHKGRRSKFFDGPGRCVHRGAARVREAGRMYRVRVEGQEMQGVPRLYPKAVERAIEHLNARPVGTWVRIEALEDGKEVEQVRFRAVQVAVPVPDGPGVEGIDRWADYLNRTYVGNGTFRFAGICVCKPNSDHRDCAACDDFDTLANMRKQNHEALTNSDYYHTKYTILQQTIYFPDGHGGYTARPHTGQYHAHLHVSVHGGVPGKAC
jgi:hypothetical protein